MASFRLDRETLISLRKLALKLEVSQAKVIRRAVRLLEDWQAKELQA